VNKDTSEEKKMMLDSCKRVISIIGNQAKVRMLLAENGIEISRSAVTQWKKIPANKVEFFHKATRGQVSKHEMRPKIFLKEV
jgi:DNA-binding transcriptional regulator YdaS (Cro superfamily)